MAQAIIHSAFTEQDIAFIGERDFFFLSSVDPDGYPTVSYKGGAPGFVTVENGELVLPCYDGNGMFLSMGNIAADPKVGLLFMDLERPRRLRVHGLARLDESAAREAFPGALLLVRVTPLRIFVNCPRYVHKYARVGMSTYVPRGRRFRPPCTRGCKVMQHDALSPADQAAVAREGFLSVKEYEAKVQTGDG